MDHKIRYRNIVLALVCVFLSIGFFVAGGFRSLFLLPAFLFLIAYFLICLFFLRCPNCGAFINLEQLFYAAYNRSFCRHCGEAIEVCRGKSGPRQSSGK